MVEEDKTRKNYENLDSLKEKLVAVTSEIDAIKSSFSKNTEDLSRIQSMLSIGHIDDIGGVIEKYESRIAEAERQRTEAAESSKKYSEELEKEKERLIKLWDAYKNQEEELSSTERRIAEFENRAKSSEVAQKQMESDYTTRIRTLEQKLSENENKAYQFDEYKQKCEELDNIKNNLETKVNTLKVENERKEKEINELNEKLDEKKDMENYAQYKNRLLNEIREFPAYSLMLQSQLDELFARLQQRSFFWLFVALLVVTSLAIVSLQNRFNDQGSATKSLYILLILVLIGLVNWLLPGLTLFGRIVSTVIYLTVLSLFLIDSSDIPKFRDHFRFLLMVFIYSGFWILYFQMFDSVLWYVNAYVDASSLNAAVNSFLGFFGIQINWFFDVEHVTAINAGTIILLQLIVSNIVKHTKALPTMVVGILLGTLGMAILAISTGIWVFLIGIIIFSVGEMTAHPKFISYVGQKAPKERVATYMGYIFLYGVIGSSIGSILGANLYVHFVDKLHQPKTLWLIFAGIGVATIFALLIYNIFFPHEKETT